MRNGVAFPGERILQEGKENSPENVQVEKLTCGSGEARAGAAANVEKES
jgi:hypothetical protein